MRRTGVPLRAVPCHGVGWRLDTEQVMLVFKEPAWENGSFAGGRLIHT